jgi:leucine dehydrogenase
VVNSAYNSPEVHLVADEQSGLKAAIVLHSTALGPAAGGCRFWTYASHEEMVGDACRLAEGMSYKNALADLPLGGGKSVLSRPAGDFDRHKLFRTFGQAVADLKGRYVTAEDVGTSVADMRAVAEMTSHVAGLPPKEGQPGGDPSPWTALGVFQSMEAAVRQRLSRPLSECTVAIQGVGNVGASLAQLLHSAGARLVIADVNRQAVEQVVTQTGAQTVANEDILAVEADVFAPCALGGIINHATVGRLKAAVVCGAANNQLLEVEDGDRLADRDILYAPDYVVNAGGIINVAAEYLGWTSADALARVEATAQRLERVLRHAAVHRLAPNRAADDLAREIIAAGADREVAAA